MHPWRAQSTIAWRSMQHPQCGQGCRRGRGTPTGAARPKHAWQPTKQELGVACSAGRTWSGLAPPLACTPSPPASLRPFVLPAGLSERPRRSAFASTSLQRRYRCARSAAGAQGRGRVRQIARFTHLEPGLLLRLLDGLEDPLLREPEPLEEELPDELLLLDFAMARPGRHCAGRERVPSAPFQVGGVRGQLLTRGEAGGRRPAVTDRRAG